MPASMCGRYAASALHPSPATNSIHGLAGC